MSLTIKALEGVGTLPVELVTGECRIVHPDRVTVPESKWSRARGSYERLDFETFEIAIRNGLVFAIACDPEEQEAVNMAARYETPEEVETYYDAKARLLWIRAAPKGKGV